MLNAYLQPVASRENLFGATVAYALAALTRYAGLVFIIAAGLSLLLLREGKIKSRLSDALLFGFGGSLPILIFLCRNWILAGNATNRPAPYWHPPELQAILDGVHVVLMWFLPDRVALQLNSYVNGHSCYSPSPR